MVCVTTYDAIANDESPRDGHKPDRSARARPDTGGSSRQLQLNRLFKVFFAYHHPLVAGQDALRRANEPQQLPTTVMADVIAKYAIWKRRLDALSVPMNHETSRQIDMQSPIQGRYVHPRDALAAGHLPRAATRHNKQGDRDHALQRASTTDALAQKPPTRHYLEVRTQIQKALVGLMLILSQACTAGPAFTPVSCGVEFLDALLAEGLISTVGNGGPLDAWVAADTSLKGLEGLVIDPHPLSRGQHPVARFWRHPTTCEIAGGAYLSGPRLSDVATGRSHVGVDHAGTWRVRGLLVTGADPASQVDSAAWGEAFRALGVQATHLHRPSVEEFVWTLRTETCANLKELEVLWLVMTGETTSAEQGWIFEDQTLTFDAFNDLLGSHCHAAALHLLVLDGSHLGTLVETFKAPTPTLVWAASTIPSPLAPRTGRGGGGLLTQALVGDLQERAAAHCLGEHPSVTNPGGWRSVNPSVRELWDVFQGTDMTERMRAARWRALDEAAMIALGVLEDPLAYDHFFRAFTADIPEIVVRSFGDIDDVTVCHGPDVCQSVHEACPLGPCQAWSCVEGHCKLTRATGQPCDDGNPCTLVDTCRWDGCSGSVDLCDDGLPCTIDTCLFDAGCVHNATEVNGICDDGDPCTAEDVCDAQEVCQGTVAACDDGDPCTSSLCDPIAGCTFDPQKGSCDDGDPCTHQDYCVAGTCQGWGKPCDDGEVCTVDACSADTGDCTHQAVGVDVACDDGLPCTSGDQCHEGTCVGVADTCDDGVDCTVDACGEEGCVHLPEPGTCLDGSACVSVGAYAPSDPCSLCVATNSWDPQDGLPCEDDGAPCTEDHCVAGVCTHVNTPTTCLNTSGDCVGVGESLGGCLICMGGGVGSVGVSGSVCDDGDPCTDGDACSPGGLCQGVPMACCDVEATLHCGDTLLGDTEWATNLQASWSCMPGFNFKGPEQAFHFVADCTGPVSFNLTGLGGAGVLIVPGGVDGCGAGECSTFSQLAATKVFSEGESSTIVVDSFGAKGLFNLTVQCACPAGEAP